MGESPFSDAAQYAATAKTVSGDVSVLRESAKSRAPVKWALPQGEKVNVGETIVTGYDGRALFQVADGSTFEVFPNSRFIFRKNAPNWRDLLDVVLGKVRVHIEHVNGKPNPHKVHTGTSVISVRGTTFEITVDENETTLVAVDEGLVEVRHLLLPSASRELRGGEALRIYRDQPIVYNRGPLHKLGRIMLDAALVVGGGPSPLPRTGGTGGGTIPGGGGSGPVGDTDPGTGPPTGPSAPGAPGPPLGGPGAPPPPIQ